MGAWGTSLYANDTTCDIRGDYIDKLRRGKSNEEVTQELIDQYKDIEGDREEEPLFWFALADTQWNYGRLLPEVKEKALYFLEKEDEWERWKEAGDKKLNAWIKTLTELKKKLDSPLPEKKKISRYHFYQCSWKLGDVFAYRFSGEYSKEKNFYGQYVVFRKVSEDSYWPGHIVPVVQVYKWIGEEIPKVDEVKTKDLLIQNFMPETLAYKPNIERRYSIKLIITSKKMIPENNLTFLGNISGDDLIGFQGHDYLTDNISVGWDGKGYNNSFEKYIIDRYLAWSNKD